MGFRTDKRLEFHNRGLVVHLVMTRVRDLDGNFMVTRTERLIGGQPTTTEKSIHAEDVANELFTHLMVEEANRQFEFPNRNEPRLQDVNPAAQAAIDNAYREDQ